MKKRWSLAISLILAVVFLMTVVTGCGTKEEPPKTTESAAATTTAATEATPKPLEEVTLRFFFGGDKLSATDEVWTAVSEKLKGSLNAKFEINYIGWADYKDKLSVMSSSGDKWDGNFDAFWLAFPALSAGGAYMDIKELLPQYAPNLYEACKSANVLGAVTSGGKVIGIPWTMAQNARGVLRWRSDLTEKAGINVSTNSIKTLEDYEAFLEALYKAYPDKRYLSTDQTNPWNIPAMGFYAMRDEYSGLPHAFVFSMNDPKLTVVPVETLPIFREACHKSKEWYEKGYIPKDAMVDKTDVNSYWNNGVTIVNIGNYEWSNVPTSNFWQDPSWKMDYSVLYPDKKYYNNSPLANLFCINKNAANPERTLMFCDMLETDKELYDLVMYGIKDKTYILNGEAADFPSGITAQTSNYLNWTGQWAWWKPQFMRPTPLYPAGFWEKQVEFAKLPVNIPNPLDGLSFNMDNVKNEVAKRNQLAAELIKPLQNGMVKDVDKAVDEVIAKLKEAGTDKIAAEYQRQINEFLASRQ